MDKLTICKETRAIASQTLASTLKDVLSSGKEVSEKSFARNWLTRLRKHDHIFSDGWYTPPPNGIGVLFGIVDRKGRSNYQTLRPENMWPQNNIFLTKENEMTYLFASPVDKESGIIGDFGLTLYLGSDQKIKDHLKRCFEINQQIFDYIQVGKQFSEVYTFAENIIKKAGMKNNVTSKTDPTGQDFGHTVPASYDEWSADEKELLQKAESHWDLFKDIVSQKRVFINSLETQAFRSGMAVTLEPRLTVLEDPDIPMGSFHTIVLIHSDGTKELLTQFDDIFKTLGENYIE